MAPAAVAKEVNFAVHEHKVALKYIGGVVHLPVRVFTEALTAHSEYHA
jgi:hypothetical protein